MPSRLRRGQRRALPDFCRHHQAAALELSRPVGVDGHERGKAGANPSHPGRHKKTNPKLVRRNPRPGSLPPSLTSPNHHNHRKKMIMNQNDVIDPNESVRKLVREGYTKIAQETAGSCCSSGVSCCGSTPQEADETGARTRLHRRGTPGAARRREHGAFLRQPRRARRVASPAKPCSISAAAAASTSSSPDARSARPAAPSAWT